MKRIMGTGVYTVFDISIPPGLKNNKLSSNWLETLWNARERIVCSRNIQVRSFSSSARTTKIPDLSNWDLAVVIHQIYFTT